jgi:hypothetical protein
MNEATQTIAASVGAIPPDSASAGQKWGAVLIALGVLGVLYIVIGVITRIWRPSEIVKGADGLASTSKFQWFLWIVVIIFAYIAVWVLLAEQGEYAALGAKAGLLTVLAFSTVTAVAAKGITSAYVRSGRITKPGVSLAEPKAHGTSLGGILQDDSGRPELAKIQMVVVTIITIGIFLATVIHQIVSRPGLAVLPGIDPFLVALTGISQAGYLGRKLVAADTPGWPAAALRNLPVTRSWSLIGLAVAALAILAVVIGAVFGRHGLERTTSTGHWGGVLAFALLCGLVSFAVLEIGKRLLPVRQFVQERYLLQWWATQAKVAVVPVEESWTELIEALDIRAAGRSVFGLPIQLLAAQISNAADIALTEPSRHPLLYFALTRSAEEVRALRNKFAQREAAPVAVASPAAVPAGSPQPAMAAASPSPAAPAESGPPAGTAESGPPAGTAESGPPAGAAESGPAEPGDQEILTAIASEWKKSREPGYSGGTLPLLKTQDSRDEDARSFQAAQRARTAIDSLQLAVGERWRRSIQAASVLAAALAGLLIQLAHPSETRWLYVTAAVLIGGPLAWTIRDLTAAIERWRR